MTGDRAAGRVDATEQDEVFAVSEGDRWFARNADHLSVHDDAVVRLVDLCGLRPRSVCELGAANGYRVAELQRRFGCRAVAVDASAAAVAAGRRAFPSIEVVHARIDAVPLDGAFELVIVNFVLHWVQRSHLMAAAAEIDRLVVDGGHLVIGDFLPSTNTMVPYHHLPGSGVWTFKQDYARLFTASGLYQAVLTLVGAHGGALPASDTADAERVGYAVLHKSLGAYTVRGSGLPEDRVAEAVDGGVAAGGEGR